MTSPTKIRPLSLSLSLSLAFALTLSASAYAAPSAAERETARRLMDEGKARLKANEVARAIESFQKAHDLMHVPTTGIALAKAHLEAGHLVEARDVALEIGRMPYDASEPAVFDAARKHAHELDTQLKPRIPTIRIKIKGGTPARVAVDNVEVAPSIVGEPVAVNPGKRAISAKAADGSEARAEIAIAERETKEIELTLSARREASKGGGAASASSGVRPQLVGFGNDDVDLRPSGERTPLANGLVYGGFGVGAVGLIVGGITGAMTLSKASDVEPRCQNGICDPAARGDLDSARTLATVSTIAFVAGGVGAVAGVVGLFLPRKPAQHAGTGLVWTATSSGGSPSSVIRIGLTGAGIGGTF
jgi:hypothetical protein